MSADHEPIIQGEIAKYREHRDSTPSSARFMLRKEDDALEEQVSEALLVAIPRLYAVYFADQTDAPGELYDFIDRVEQDFGIDLTDHYDPEI